MRDAAGNCRTAVLELRYCRVQLLPPRAKQSRYPALVLTVLQASERDAPDGVEPIDWKLITDLPVTSRAQAIEKLVWYSMRWKIENTNGLLRQYYPKGTDLSVYSQAQLDAVALRLNTRPRKTLDYRTPADKLLATVALTG